MRVTFLDCVNYSTGKENDRKNHAKSESVRIHKVIHFLLELFFFLFLDLQVFLFCFCTLPDSRVDLHSIKAVLEYWNLFCACRVYWYDYRSGHSAKYERIKKWISCGIVRKRRLYKRRGSSHTISDTCLILWRFLRVSSEHCRRSTNLSSISSSRDTQSHELRPSVSVSQFSRY